MATIGLVTASRGINSTPIRSQGIYGWRFNRKSTLRACRCSTGSLSPTLPQHPAHSYRDEPDNHKAQQTGHRALHRLVNSTSSGSRGARSRLVRRHHQRVGWGDTSYNFQSVPRTSTRATRATRATRVRWEDLPVVLRTADVGFSVDQFGELVGVQELPGVVVASSHVVTATVVLPSTTAAELAWATTAPATASS